MLIRCSTVPFSRDNWRMASNNHVRLYADCGMSERAKQQTYSCSVIIFQIFLSALHCGRLHLIAEYVIHLINGVNII